MELRSDVVQSTRYGKAGYGCAKLPTLKALVSREIWGLILGAVS